MDKIRIRVPGGEPCRRNVVCLPPSLNLPSYQAFHHPETPAQFLAHTIPSPYFANPIPYREFDGALRAPKFCGECFLVVLTSEPAIACRGRLKVCEVVGRGAESKVRFRHTFLVSNANVPYNYKYPNDPVTQTLTCV
jgi:hypothetical protein